MEGSPVLVQTPEADAEGLEHKEWGQQLFLQHLHEAWQGHMELVHAPAVQGGQYLSFIAVAGASPVVLKWLLAWHEYMSETGSQQALHAWVVNSKVASSQHQCCIESVECCIYLLNCHLEVDLL